MIENYFLVVTMEITDSINGFLSWYDSAKSLPDSEKISSFKSTVYPLDPLYYDFKFKAIVDSGENPDKRILELFSELDPLRDKFEQLHANLILNLETGLTLLNKTFPEFVIDIPFHICHSLGECDGGTRKLNGSTVMILGIDIMARIHQWNNEIPFIQHELFHIYHEQLYHASNEAPYHEEALYNGLWMEGLATYISHILNPAPTFAELLLDTPHNLIPDTESNKAVIAHSLLDKLYSHEPDDYATYFLFRNQSIYPKRCGYYIGFLAVKNIALSVPLEKLIRFSEKEFIPHLQASLKLMSNNDL